MSALGGLVLWLQAYPVYSQESIFLDLVKPTQSKVNIAVPHFVSSGGSADESFAKKSHNILENDLRLFELFVPVAPNMYSELAQKRSPEREGELRRLESVGSAMVDQGAI